MSKTLVKIDFNCEYYLCIGLEFLSHFVNSVLHWFSHTLHVALHGFLALCCWLLMTAKISLRIPYN